MTVFAKLTASPEALAAWILRSQKEDPSPKWCRDEVCLDLLDDPDFVCTDEMQSKCLLAWLGEPLPEETFADQEVCP